MATKSPVRRPRGATSRGSKVRSHASQRDAEFTVMRLERDHLAQANESLRKELSTARDGFGQSVECGEKLVRLCEETTKERDAARVEIAAAHKALGSTADTIQESRPGQNGLHPRKLTLAERISHAFKVDAFRADHAPSNRSPSVGVGAFLGEPRCSVTGWTFAKFLREVNAARDTARSLACMLSAEVQEHARTKDAPPRTVSITKSVAWNVGDLIRCEDGRLAELVPLKVNHDGTNGTPNGKPFPDSPCRAPEAAQASTNGEAGR